MNKWAGLNFRNETLWRGRMLASTYLIRGTLYEIGGWIAALLIAFQVAGTWPQYNFILPIAVFMFVRMSAESWGDWRRLKHAEEQTEAYMSHIEGVDDPSKGPY